MKQDLFAWPEVEGDANIHGPLSFAIPSAVAGYAHMHGRWGVLPLADVIAPALGLAKRGLSQDWFTTLKIANSRLGARPLSHQRRHLPARRPAARRALPGRPGFFRLGRLPDTLGPTWPMPACATSTRATSPPPCRRLRERSGSLLTAEDLRRCEASACFPPPASPWHGRTIQLATGLTAGPTYTPRAGRDAGYAPAAAAGCRRGTPPCPRHEGRLCRPPERGLGETEPKAAESCTTHLTVCDEAGTMVAVTTTLAFVDGQPRRAAASPAC